MMTANAAAVDIGDRMIAKECTCLRAQGKIPEAFGYVRRIYLLYVCSVRPVGSRVTADDKCFDHLVSQE